MNNEMIMWGGIMLTVLLAAGAAFVFLINRIMRLNFMKKLKRKSTRILASIAVVLLGILICSLCLSAINAIIVLLHVILFWAICDFVAFIIGKISSKTISHGIPALVSIILTVSYLCICFYLADHVWETDYSLKSSKQVGSVKVVQFADSHMGTTFSGEEFIEYIDMINAVQPDVVLITGDFVDDNTGLKDMQDACKALSKLETKYGVYFSFGNHDKGYGDASSRGYNEYDLIQELEANGVVVLEDEVVLIDDRFYIVGRQDKSEESRSSEGRATAEELMAGLDSDKYVIFMDHQPNDYDNESKVGADLVLSGHTHGGQLIPVNEVGVWIGANDKTYGYERRSATDFIVTSGISDWEILFKSGCKSEFVVIDISDV